MGSALAKTDEIKQIKKERDHWKKSALRAAHEIDQLEASQVNLVKAASRAASKLKIEYDRTRPGEIIPDDECWSECEALWEELANFLRN
jgi:hypothetical protein